MLKIFFKILLENILKRTIITIAVGKELYVKYASNLALSFLYWNKNSDIEFKLVTDLSHLIDERIKHRIIVKAVKPSDIEIGFSSKLSLINYLNKGANLFIDADCLIYGDVSEVFNQFKDFQISAVGHTITSGLNTAFVKNVAATLNELKLKYFPVICGSVYYFNNEDTELTNQFFNYAQQLKLQYENIGLIKLRNKENEEPIFALCMSKFQFKPLKDTGKLKADRMFYQHNMKNILTGKAYLSNTNNPPIPLYCKLKEAFPLIIHYNARHTDSYEYKSDVKRLELVILKKHSLKNAEFYVTLCIEWPSVLKIKILDLIKETFRPIYRKFFGTRKVKKSIRV